MISEKPPHLILMNFWVKYRCAVLSSQKISNQEMLSVLTLLDKVDKKLLPLHQKKIDQLKGQLLIILIIRKPLSPSKQILLSILQSINKEGISINLEIKLELIQYLLNPQQCSNAQLLQQSMKGITYLNKNLQDIVNKHFQQTKIISQDNQPEQIKDKLQQTIHNILRYKQLTIENIIFIDKIIKYKKPDKNKYVNKNTEMFYNRKFCDKIKSLILSTSNCSLIELFFSMLTQINKNSKTPISQYSSINLNNSEEQICTFEDFCKNQHLYELYWSNNMRPILSQSKCKTVMPFFEFHLFKIALLSQYCVFINYFPYFKCCQTNQKPTFAYIQQLIGNKDMKLWSLLRSNIHFIPPMILQHYTQQSGFNLNKSRVEKMKQRLRTRQHSQTIIQENRMKQNLNLYDPLQFLTIKKQYWVDEFAGELLSTCLWIATQSWVKRIKSQNNNSQANEKISNEEYRTTLNLIVIQFAISMGIQPNVITKYNIIQNNLASPMFRLPSFATLVYKQKNLQFWPWKNIIMQEASNILPQQNGYYLLNLLKGQRNNTLTNLTSLMIEQAQNELKNKNSLSQERKRQLWSVLSTLPDSEATVSKKLPSLVKFLKESQ